MPTEIKNIESNLNLQNTHEQKLLGVFVFVQTKAGKIKFVCLNNPERVEIQSDSWYKFSMSYNAVKKIEDIELLNAKFHCNVFGALEMIIDEIGIEHIGDKVNDILQRQ